MGTRVESLASRLDGDWSSGAEVLSRSHIGRAEGLELARLPVPAARGPLGRVPRGLLDALDAPDALIRECLATDAAVLLVHDGVIVRGFLTAREVRVAGMSGWYVTFVVVDSALRGRRIATEMGEALLRSAPVDFVAASTASSTVVRLLGRAGYAMFPQEGSAEVTQTQGQLSARILDSCLEDHGGLGPGNLRLSHAHSQQLYRLYVAPVSARFNKLVDPTSMHVGS